MGSLFNKGLSQHARLITLASAHQGDLPEALVVERFTGVEAVNALFCFDIDALSVSTDLERLCCANKEKASLPFC
jgi:type VI secretion system secreted protein VgrG